MHIDELAGSPADEDENLSESVFYQIISPV
jgi:hypothetical protein